MKIQLASDLHLEFLGRHFPGETVIRPVADADVLVLAGDIHVGTAAIDLFRDWPVPVLYVVGNHEAYGLCLDDVREQLAIATRGTSITVLERDTADYGGVRFLGCTLWTDYLLLPDRSQQALMSHAATRLNDHRRIRLRNGDLFSPEQALAEHLASREWLSKELAKPYDGTTVVVTHHGPHPLSVHPRYEGDDLNAAFVSNLTELLGRADYWLHGHVHDSFDYLVEGCRVVANPRGYATNSASCGSFAQLRFENPGFQYACLVDVVPSGPHDQRLMSGALSMPKIE
jgi:Icc-related predicted phosphoesterase